MASGGSDWSTAEATSIVVIGKTGTGKSATCNTILETDKFKEGKGAMSMTESPQCVEMHARGRMLYVIDTPGTMDVTDVQRALQELLKAIDLCPDGIDAFLLTFRCDVRATEDEITAAEEALDTFGPECYKRAIVVFTHGKKYDNDKDEFSQDLTKIRQKIPRMDSLLKKLGNRWVLLENKNKSNKEVQDGQVMNLLKMVDAVAKSNPRRYLKKDQEQAVVMRKEQLDEFERRLMQLMAMQQQGQQQVMQFMMLQAALQLHSREMSHALEGHQKDMREMYLQNRVDQLSDELRNAHSRESHDCVVL